MGNMRCYIDPKNQTTGISQSLHPSQTDPRGCSQGLGTSLGHASGFKRPVTQLGGTLGHLRTGTAEGFA